MEPRSTLFFLVAVMALGACGKGDPVSSLPPAADSGTAAKRTSSGVTVSAPVAGLAESANPGTPGKDGNPGKPGRLVFAESADAAEEWGADRFQLSAASITGDTLAVTVSYSGGCQDNFSVFVTFC